MDRLILPSRLHGITDRHSFFLIFYGFYAYTNTERLAPSLLRIACFASVKYQERMQLERGGGGPGGTVGILQPYSTVLLKGIYTPAGIAYIFKFGLTWSLHLLYDTGSLSY